jgi:AraC family transcriptional regulator
VTEFVDSHLDEQLSISVLATVAGLSERHFSRAFRQEVGETPHRWLMRRRIERAKHMLANTEKSLQCIAEECGFLAISHFGRVFKDFTDETPKRWQDRCRRTKV